MATFPSLCEVSYDQRDVLEIDEFVPYRYRNLSSAPSAKFRGTSAVRADVSTSLSLYDYEPYTVGCRTPVTPRTFSPYRPNTGISSCYSSYYPLPSRAYTLPPNSFTYEASLADTLCPARRSQERAHTAPLPNLPTARKAMSILSQEQMKEDDVNLKWIPALNTWVAEKKTQNAAPFVTFVNSIQLFEKEQQYEYEDVDVEALPTLPCGRFLAHMHMHRETNKSLQEKRQFQIKKRHKMKVDRNSAIAILKEAKKKRESPPPMLPSKSPTKVRFVKSPSPLSSPSTTPPPPKPKPVSPPPPPKIPTPVPSPPPPPPPLPPEIIEVQPEEPEPAEEPAQESQVVDERTITPAAPSEPPEPSPIPSPSPSPTPQPPTPIPPVVIEVTSPAPTTPSPPPRTPDPPPRESTPLPPPSPDPPPWEPTPAPPTPPPPAPPPREPTPPPPKPPTPQPPTPDLAISQTADPPTVEPITSPVAATPPRQKTPTPPPPAAPKMEDHPPSTKTKTKSKKNKPGKGKGPAKPESPKEKEKPKVQSVEVQAADGPDLKPVSLVSETRSTKKSLSSSENQKRTRWRAKHQPKKKDSPLPDTPSPDAYPMPEFTFHRVGDWIYGDEDFSVPLPDDFHKDRNNEEDSSMDAIASPTPPLTPPTVHVPSVKPPKELKKMPPAPKKKRWGKKQVDSSYADELRRQLQAEERKQKQQEMLEKMRQKKKSAENKGRSQSPKFEDYGWLAKYCILNKGTVDMFRKAFDIVDDGAKGWLTITETLIGMRAINQRLSRSEEHYIQRILEVTGYKLNDGADFKLFCVVAALSLKVAGLDEWLKQMISDMDYQMLDLRICLARTLWECNVDPDTQTISMDQMCVELQAGGVSPEHELEVRDKLGHICALDLLDFLTYIPLFLMVHNSVVKNPLDDTRTK